MGRVWPCHALSSSMPMARFSTCMPPSAAIARPRVPTPSVSPRSGGQATRIYLDADACGPLSRFWTLTERALDLAFARFPSVDKALKPKLLGAYLTLDAFPDARAILRDLKAR